jgi:hypothetical protein
MNLVRLASAAALGFVVLVVTPAMGASTSTAIEIVPKLELGQTIDEVRRAHPELRPLRVNLGSSFAEGAPVSRFVLRGVVPVGLQKSTDVELRFWKERVWIGIVYFGDNRDEDVRAALEKRYGEIEKSTDQPWWSTDEYAVTAQMARRWYSVQEPKMSAEAQSWLVEELGRRDKQKSVVPPVEASPSAARVGEK